MTEPLLIRLDPGGSAAADGEVKTRTSHHEDPGDHELDERDARDDLDEPAAQALAPKRKRKQTTSPPVADQTCNAHVELQKRLSSVLMDPQCYAAASDRPWVGDLSLMVSQYVMQQRQCAFKSPQCTELAGLQSRACAQHACSFGTCGRCITASRDREYNEDYQHLARSMRKSMCKEHSDYCCVCRITWFWIAMICLFAACLTGLIYVVMNLRAVKPNVIMDAVFGSLIVGFTDLVLLYTIHPPVRRLVTLLNEGLWSLVCCSNVQSFFQCFRLKNPSDKGALDVMVSNTWNCEWFVSTIVWSVLDLTMFILFMVYAFQPWPNTLPTTHWWTAVRLMPLVWSLVLTIPLLTLAAKAIYYMVMEGMCKCACNCAWYWGCVAPEVDTVGDE